MKGLTADVYAPPPELRNESVKTLEQEPKPETSIMARAVSVFCLKSYMHHTGNRLTQVVLRIAFLTAENMKQSVIADVRAEPEVDKLGVYLAAALQQDILQLNVAMYDV